MNDYVIGRCSRRCRVSDRPLEPGERFYSVAVSTGGEIVRFDIAESSWTGAPPDAVGWWRGKMAPTKPKRIVPTPNAQLVEVLGQLCDDPEQHAVAHMLGVLLVRRKVLHEEPDEELPADNTPSHQRLVHHTTEQVFFVPVVEPDAASVQVVQEMLQSLLYTEG
jgi:hypothetical protein